MGNYLDNYNVMNRTQKEEALRAAIQAEETYLEITSNPMKLKRRKKYINELKQRLFDLINTPPDGGHLAGANNQWL